MTGLVTAAAVTAGAAVGGLALNVVNSGKQSSVANQAQYQSGVVFGEQQQYAQMLNNLISNPGSVQSLPGFSFNEAQGEQAVARSFGPSQGSGAEGIALQQYGQNYATQAYQTQVGVLSQLAGLSSPVNPTQSLNTASGALAQSNSSMQGALGTLGFLGLIGPQLINQAGGGGGIPSASTGGASAGGSFGSLPTDSGGGF